MVKRLHEVERYPGRDRRGIPSPPMQERSFPMKKMLSLMLAVLMVLSLGMSRPVLAAEEETPKILLAGAAERDITPTPEMFPIRGVACTLVGVIEPMKLRVIALSNGEEEEKSLILSFDTGKGPYPMVVLPKLCEHTGVKEENVFWSTTHAHAVPEIRQDIFAEDTTQAKWGNYVIDQLLDAADEAIAAMEPCEVGIGYTDCYINVNRNAAFKDEEGNPVRNEGYNPYGPSDKTLAVVEFRSTQDQHPVAFIINYAVHNVVMFANQFFAPEYEGINYQPEEKYSDEGVAGVHSDIAGLVTRYMESRFEGAPALWMSGAAGDQNPLLRNNLQVPAEDGQYSEINIAGASTEICEFFALEQFADCLTAIENIPAFDAAAKISHNYGGSFLPGREPREGEELNRYANIEKWGDDVPVFLNITQIGDIALCGFAGEMFNSVGTHMIQESIVKNTLFVNHCWTHEKESCNYFCDDFSLLNGGPKTEQAFYRPGYINAVMTELMNSLLDEIN